MTWDPSLRKEEQREKLETKDLPYSAYFKMKKKPEIFITLLISKYLSTSILKGIG